LGMAQSNLTRFISRNPRVGQAVKDARENLTDDAEEGLEELIKRRDFKAIQLRLLTHGKNRGYVLPRGTALNAGDVTNNVVITQVEIRAIDSGKWFEPEPSAPTIEGQLAQPEPEKGDD
jgi:hypothetical protein